MMQLFLQLLMINILRRVLEHLGPLAKMTMSSLTSRVHFKRLRAMGDSSLCDVYLEKFLTTVLNVCFGDEFSNG